MAEFKLEINNPIISPKKVAPGKYVTTDYDKDRLLRQSEVGNRISQYGNIGRQLDMLWHDIDNGKIVADTETANTWYAHVKRIKTRNPVRPMPERSNTAMEPVFTSFNPVEQ